MRLRGIPYPSRKQKSFWKRGWLLEKYNIAMIPPVTRRDYIDSLEKAHIDDRDFVEIIAHMVRETQKDYLRLFLK